MTSIERERARCLVLSGSELDWRLALVDLAILDGQLANSQAVAEVIIEPTRMQ